MSIYRHNIFVDILPFFRYFIHHFRCGRQKNGGGIVSAPPFYRYFLGEVSLFNSHMLPIITSITMKIPSMPSPIISSDFKNASIFILNSLSVYSIPLTMLMMSPPAITEAT